MNRDTNIPNKILVNLIQQFVERILYVNEWHLFEECKPGKMLKG